ncbi:hypothetical protein AVEN_148040-1 [Araneus ventricosus]|uniref:Transposase IS30-like HTH domain-containing protein n=1 Tax=Araneus ventricosus TaxID=182803 RepID=A0A4Y2PGT7_ARAVE|nr:hypothetical protein AVEN_148040-1 [Araneus ventricosus]
MHLKGNDITPEEKKIVLKVTNEGKTSPEIGTIVGRSHSAIQRLISNYNSLKSVISKPRNGRPSKLTNCEKSYIIKSMCLNPRTITSQIANEIRKKFEKNSS